MDTGSTSPGGKTFNQIAGQYEFFYMNFWVIRSIWIFYMNFIARVYGGFWPIRDDITKWSCNKTCCSMTPTSHALWLANRTHAYYDNQLWWVQEVEITWYLPLTIQTGSLIVMSFERKKIYIWATDVLITLMPWIFKLKHSEPGFCESFKHIVNKW